MFNFKKLFNSKEKEDTKLLLIEHQKEAFNITKSSKNSEIYFRFGWTIPRGYIIDIDAFGILVNDFELCPDIHHLVHFNSSCKDYLSNYSMEHIFRNELIDKKSNTITEYQDIKINFNLIPSDITKIRLGISTYKFQYPLHHVKDIFVNIIEKDLEGNEVELGKLNISSELDSAFCAILSDVYMKDGEWIISSFCEKMLGNLDDVAYSYGIRA